MKRNVLSFSTYSQIKTGGMKICGKETKTTIQCCSWNVEQQKNIHNTQKTTTIQTITLFIYGFFRIYLKMIRYLLETVYDDDKTIHLGNTNAFFHAN